MKNELVLSLVLISLILCFEQKDFDLTNGDKYRFPSFQKDGVYKFYIKAKKSQNVTIAFYTEGIPESSLSYISIYEYSNRKDEIENDKKNLSMVNIVHGYTNLGDSVTFASYIVNLPYTNYISFEASPKYQITPLIRIDVIDGVYDL